MKKNNVVTCWDVVSAVLSSTNRALLHGPPGTGKTYAACRLGLNGDQQKVFSITLTEETPAAELRGHYILKDGKYVWHDGRKGCIRIIMIERKPARFRWFRQRGHAFVQG